MSFRKQVPREAKGVQRATYYNGRANGWSKQSVEVDRNMRIERELQSQQCSLHGLKFSTDGLR